MLVISRKVQEKITLVGIGEITVVRISDTDVRIGLDFPADVKILRGELEEWKDVDAEDSADA